MRCGHEHPAMQCSQVALGYYLRAELKLLTDARCLFGALISRENWTLRHWRDLHYSEEDLALATILHPYLDH